MIDELTPYTTPPLPTHWYAAKVYFNKVDPLRKELEDAHIRTFIPSTITSLLFLRCTEEYIQQFQEKNHNRLWVYGSKAPHKPTIIPDEEMEIFIFVATSGLQGLIYLGDDKPEYHTGDRVRVTQGPLKGAEGYIKRIKKDRRLIVTVKGVAAIATTFIHPDLLEKIEP